MNRRSLRLTMTAVFGLAAMTAACDTAAPPSGPLVTPTPSKPGQTDFNSEDRNGPGNFNGGPGRGEAGGTSAPAAPGAAADGNASAEKAPPSAPGGRTADVEEGDIYKVVGNHLYHLNTYKGFLVYDVTNPKAPARVSRLPVFGHPVEMFVEGNTIYALLRDALYLTQVGGKVEFARHNVSQLVTIDITDVANPSVLSTFDIRGELREGVARKVESTIYVVSYLARGYHWGWGWEPQDTNRKDQAWVYSFDVADRTKPRQAAELQIFDGGAVNFYDKRTGASFNRNFNGVSISATSNALMVVENWWVSSSGGRDAFTCGYYNSDQQAVVSIVDISDPKGSIRVHARFDTAGQLTDQFKQTYVHDPVTKKGTYYGIFARQGWSSSGCSGTQVVQNTIEAWDVTNGENPTRVDQLDFGLPNETVRGSAFDVTRNVAYAITARQTDPLYAIDIAKPEDLKIRSEIRGLSGDVSVFRLVGDKKFLLAVGRDNSAECTGFDEGQMDPARRGTNNIAVSLFDTNNLDAIRLVQRQCVQIKNAAWVSSDVTSNLDQAHKMLGMHADGSLNVITVPVSYWTRAEGAEADWWWDRHETAVGIMSWDLSRYAPAKSHKEQTVIQNHGTFIHPNGEVRRSVLFSHATTKERLMANLSDTHISLANLQDLSNPQRESVIEIAPYLGELFRFGGHIVEQVQPRGANYWDSSRSAVEFRVKPAGGPIDNKAPVATFTVPQVERAVKHGENLLVVFRRIPAVYNYNKTTNGSPGLVSPEKSEAVVFDLSDPTQPRRTGRVAIPQELFPYYRFYCGSFWPGYWWGYGGDSSWAATDTGLVMARAFYEEEPATRTSRSGWKLIFLDLRTPAQPKLNERTLSLPRDASVTGLMVDEIDRSGFYVGYRTYQGEAKRADGTTFYKWKDYAARFELDGVQYSQRSTVNVPGRLLRTFRSADAERLLLTTDYVGEWVTEPAKPESGRWASWTRVSLLREIRVGARPAAELLDEQIFKDLALASLVADSDRLFVNGRRSSPWWGGYYGGVGGTEGPRAAGSSGAVAPMAQPDPSDRLMAFDLSNKRLELVYDAGTKMYNVNLMGVRDGRLFANLEGDGILVLDVRNAAQPSGLHFERTLGYVSHIDFAGDDVYVGAGFFGTTHFDLKAARSLASE